MAEKIDLKPCPFCGHEALLLNVAGTDIFVVGCSDDNLCPGYAGKLAPWYFGKETATVMWNRRAKEVTDSNEKIRMVLALGE